MKEEPELVGLGFVTGGPVGPASSPGCGSTGCAAVASREDAVLDERSTHLRSLVVRALEGGDRGQVGVSKSPIAIMRILYDDVARSTHTCGAQPEVLYHDRGARMDKPVDVTIPVDAEAAKALEGPVGCEAVGRYLSRLLKGRRARDVLAEAIAVRLEALRAEGAQARRRPARRRRHRAGR